MIELETVGIVELSQHFRVHVEREKKNPRQVYIIVEEKTDLGWFSMNGVSSWQVRIPRHTYSV